MRAARERQGMAGNAEAGRGGPRTPVLCLADEFRDFRTDHLAPAAPRENAVVAAAGRGVVALARGRYATAQADGGARLPLPGNIVELALAAEKGHLLDLDRPHGLPANRKTD